MKPSEILWKAAAIIGGDSRSRGWGFGLCHAIATIIMKGANESRGANMLPYEKQQYKRTMKYLKEFKPAHTPDYMYWFGPIAAYSNGACWRRYQEHRVIAACFAATLAEEAGE